MTISDGTFSLCDIYQFRIVPSLAKMHLKCKSSFQNLYFKVKKKSLINLK